MCNHKFRYLNCKCTPPSILLLKSKCGKLNLKESESQILVSVFFENSSFLAYSGQREDNLEIREF